MLSAEVINAFVSSILSSGVVALVVKTAIGKSFRELEEVSEKVGQIKAELSAITVRLQQVDKNTELVLTHDRKLAALESHLYGPRPTKSGRSCSA